MRRTTKRRRQGAPEATLTARSSARKLLQHLGSPPRMPTAWSDQESLDQPLGERNRVERALAGALDRQLVQAFGVDLGSRAKTSKKSFSSICSRSVEKQQPTQLIGHVHEQPQVAGGVLAEGLQKGGFMSLGLPAILSK